MTHSGKHGGAERDSMYSRRDFLKIGAAAIPFSAFAAKIDSVVGVHLGFKKCMAYMKEALA